MTLLLLFSGAFISAVAAYFSIAGLVAIFPGSVIAVTTMGIALELGKLVSASWIYRSWNKVNYLIRGYFISAVFILSFITSIGIFGYLTKAHIEGTQGLDNNSSQVEFLDSQIQTEQQRIETSRNSLRQLDAVVNTLSAGERTTERAIQVRNSQRRERTALNAEISEATKALQTLQQERLTLTADQRKLEVEVGPIKYVAQLVYGTDDVSTIDKAVRLLTLLLIFVFDPLAILMLVAANINMQQKPEEKSEIEKHIEQSAKPAPQKKQPPKKVPLKELPKTNDIAETKRNIHEMKADWNPSNWFKMVKEPKK